MSKLTKKYGSKESRQAFKDRMAKDPTAPKVAAVKDTIGLLFVNMPLSAQKETLAELEELYKEGKLEQS